MRGAAAWLAAALVLGGLAWRVLLGECSPGTFDEVSFLRALGQYDLLAFEPHFPGYALSVLLARIPHALGSSAPYAWVAGVLGVLVAPWVYAAAGRGAGGVLACAALAGSPLAASLGVRPLADAGASALLVGGVALVLRQRPRLAALLLGAAAAAKPDYALFGSALLPLLASRPWRQVAATLGCWVGPLALAVWAAALGCGGWGPFVGEAARFVHGHLFEWGGTAAVDGRPRLLRFARPLGEALGAQGWVAFPAVIAALALMVRAPLQARRAVVWAVLPYVLYTVFAQNLEHPRHVLPLVLIGALLAGQGLNRLRAPRAWRWALLVVLACGALSGTWRQAYQREARGRPTDALLALLEGCDPLGTRLYTGQQARPLRERGPALDVRAARDLADVARLVAADPAPPPVILVGSQVAGAQRLPLVLGVEGLTLYRWDPSRAGL